MKQAVAALLMLWAGAASAQEWVVFQSPTGNIHCMMMADPEYWVGTRCDILEAEMSFAVPPADCEFDWGHAFEVPARGAAAPACVGDTVASPDAPVLGYGQSVSHGGVTCTSEKTGMTCTNGEGHGFTLSRARQSIF